MKTAGENTAMSQPISVNRENAETPRVHVALGRLICIHPHINIRHVGNRLFHLHRHFHKLTIIVQTISIYNDLYLGVKFTSGGILLPVTLDFALYY